MKPKILAFNLRPIEVRELLTGTLTELRRPVRTPLYARVHGRKPLWEQAWVDPGGSALFGPGPYLHLPYGGGDFPDVDECTGRVFPPYYAGDTLLGREAWKEVPKTAYWHDPSIPHRVSPEGYEWAVYKESWERSRPGVWRSGARMPLWASRWTLEVLAVRLERAGDTWEWIWGVREVKA